MSFSQPKRMSKSKSAFTLITFTVATAESLQNPFSTYTVYVVVTVGETVIDWIISVVFHN